MNKADELAKLSKNNPGLFWNKGKKIDKKQGDRDDAQEITAF